MGEGPPQPMERREDPAGPVARENRKRPSLLEHLENELRKLAEDGPVVEVLDDSKPHPRQNAPSPSPMVDPMDQRRKQIAEAEKRKKEAARQLAEAKRKARKSKRTKSRSSREPTLADVGVHAGELRRLVRHPARLRTAIVLNTLIEKPKALQSESSGS